MGTPPYVVLDLAQNFESVGCGHVFGRSPTDSIQSTLDVLIILAPFTCKKIYSVSFPEPITRTNVV